MDVLNPAVVDGRVTLGNMVLEDDHVRVRNLLCIRRGDERSSIVVDGVHEDWRACRQQREEGETQDGLHDDDGDNGRRG